MAREVETIQGEALVSGDDNEVFTSDPLGGPGGDNNPCCGCRPRPVCLWYPFARCGTILCAPCQPYDTAWTCIGPIPPEPGLIAFTSGRPPNDDCQVSSCYVYNGAAPLPDGQTPPPGSIVFGGNYLPPGSTCGEACYQDLCGNWVELTPCHGHSACGSLVYAPRAAIAAGCQAFAIICGGSSHCYCPTGRSLGTLPPGALQAQGSTTSCHGCCACKYAADFANGITIPDCSWGPGPPGQTGPLHPDGCCCGRMVDLSASLSGSVPGFPNLSLLNKRNCSRESPNWFACDYDVMSSAGYVTTIRIGFSCGGIVRLEGVAGNPPQVPLGIALVFNTVSNQRDCQIWTSHSSISYAVGTIEITCEDGGCNSCGGGSVGSLEDLLPG